MKNGFPVIKIFTVIVLVIIFLVGLANTYRQFVLAEAWLVINSEKPIFEALDKLEDLAKETTDNDKTSLLHKKINEEKKEIEIIQGIILSASDQEIESLSNASNYQK